MTRETKTTLVNLAAGSVASLLVVIGGLAALSSGWPFQDSEAAAEDLQAAPVTYAEKENEFEEELTKSLDSNHSAIMSELEAQAAVLQRIEDSLQDQDEPVEEVVKSEEPERKSPARMSEVRWNVMGTWNYSTEMLANHLLNDHKVEVDGFTREELQIIHDNIHNGFDPMGNGIVTGRIEQQTIKTKSSGTVRRSRGGLFRGGLFNRTYSCPGGR